MFIEKIAEKSAMKKYYVTAAAIFLAVALIAFGIKNDGNMEVFNKARMICLECIGIG